MRRPAWHDGRAGRGPARTVLCVVGARPNFMKAAPVIAALRRRGGIRTRLVHTGQHYDRAMSDRFFEDLGLPRPDLDLQVGSGSHGEQTGQILLRLEPVLLRERPDLVMVFGDVNSTLAGALCAAKLGLAVAHVEAGLRSFDRTMPEELNRVVTDHLADYLFATEPSAVANLRREGIPGDRIFFVGNVMVDTLLAHRERARALDVLDRLAVAPRGYGLLTLHRPANVDEPERLADILRAVARIAEEFPILFPCHPRTRERLAHRACAGLVASAADRAGWRGLRVMEPLGYLECLALMDQARLVLTDSGGIQEETTVLGVPCVTLRENTERPVTVEQGTNVLGGTRSERILAAAARALRNGAGRGRRPERWDGRAAERIAEVLHGRLVAPPARAAAATLPR